MPKAPKCAHGHVYLGFHGVTGFATCQRKVRGRICGRHAYILGVLDHCIVVDLSRDEFDEARKSNELPEHVRADLSERLTGRVAKPA